MANSKMVIAKGKEMFSTQLPKETVKELKELSANVEIPITILTNKFLLHGLHLAKEKGVIVGNPKGYKNNSDEKTITITLPKDLLDNLDFIISKIPGVSKDKLFVYFIENYIKEVGSFITSEEEEEINAEISKG